MNTAEILSLRKGDIISGIRWKALGEYTVCGVRKEFGNLSVILVGQGRVSSGDLSDAHIVERYVEPKKLSLMEKLAGCTFKFGLLKNTRGAKNQDFIDQYSGSEFVFQSFSGAYVYGYPVGHFGDPDYRCQFDASAVRFFHEDQDSVDSVPDITLLKKIKHTADL